jgi:hypothetical protein
MRRIFRHKPTGSLRKKRFAPVKRPTTIDPVIKSDAHHRKAASMTKAKNLAARGALFIAY